MFSSPCCSSVTRKIENTIFQRIKIDRTNKHKPSLKCFMVTRFLESSCLEMKKREWGIKTHNTFLDVMGRGVHGGGDLVYHRPHQTF